MRRLFAAAIAAFACLSAMAASAAESPLRVAVFVDIGASNIGAYRWLEIATTAGNVVATPVDGASVRAGALDEADVIIMPGGGARRVKEGFSEVLLALSTDMDGDATAGYVAEVLKGTGARVTRLAFGLPADSGIAYSDPLTLRRAVAGRMGM